MYMALNNDCKAGGQALVAWPTSLALSPYSVSANYVLSSASAAMLMLDTEHGESHDTAVPIAITVHFTSMTPPPNFSNGC
mgnify:CR=1 FL=1